MNQLPMRTLLLASVLFFSLGSQAQELLRQERFDNGRLKSSLYKEGGIVRFITYYESGRVKEQGAFRSGKREGTWKQFDEAGVLLSLAEFDQGVRSGTWEIRAAEGGASGRLYFQDGLLAAAEEVGENGEVLAQRIYGE